MLVDVDSEIADDALGGGGGAVAFLPLVDHRHVFDDDVALGIAHDVFPELAEVLRADEDAAAGELSVVCRGMACLWHHHDADVFGRVRDLEARGFVGMRFDEGPFQLEERRLALPEEAPHDLAGRGPGIGFAFGVSKGLGEEVGEVAHGLLELGLRDREVGVPLVVDGDLHPSDGRVPPVDARFVDVEAAERHAPLLGREGRRALGVEELESVGPVFDQEGVGRPGPGVGVLEIAEEIERGGRGMGQKGEDKGQGKECGGENRQTDFHVRPIKNGAGEGNRTLV